MSASVTILGSCVSRDILRAENNIKLNEYYARTALQSIFGRKYIIDKDKLISPHESYKKYVYNDFASTFLEHDFKKNEYLLIDFIDERFSLISLEGEITGTLSSDYSETNAKKIVPYSKIVPNSFDLWKSGFDKLIVHLKKQNMIDRVVLHKCYYKYSYKDENGVIVEFPRSGDYIKNVNNRLDSMYTYVENKLPNIKKIEDKESQFVCDKNHIWGLAPMHYERDYYVFMCKELECIVNE